MTDQASGGGWRDLMTSRDGAWDALLKWMLFTAATVLAAVVLEDYGLITYVFEADHSRISIAIAALFLGFCAHCLWILVEMGREARAANRVEAALRAMPAAASPAIGPELERIAGPSMIATYLRDAIPALSHAGEGDRTLLLQSLAASLKRRTKIGTWGTDLLYKLGMLGTMVGFVMMLNSMGDLQDFDIETLRGALQKMIAGMAVSLLTTITGLVGGILLRVQYNFAEGLATDILQTALRLTEVQLQPRLMRGSGDV